MIASDMAPDELRAWRKRMGWKREEAARRIGISLASYAFCEKGSRPDTLEDVKISMPVSWACVALEAGVDNKWATKEEEN